MNRPLLGWDGLLAGAAVSVLSMLTDVLLIPVAIWDNVQMGLSDHPQLDDEED